MPQVTRQVFSAAALACLMCLPAAHAADVIDFESGALTGLYLPGESFTSGSYTLTTQLDFGIVDVAAALGSVAPSGNATQFYFNANDGRLALARTDATGFNLLSFSFAFVPLDPAASLPTVLVATGTTMAAATVSASWAFAPGNASSFPFASAVPVGFENLASVVFRTCSNASGVDCNLPTLNNGQFAIDSIQVSAVPEPGSALLLALGLAAFGLRQRRQAR